MLHYSFRYLTAKNVIFVAILLTFEDNLTGAGVQWREASILI